jgi:hypothetical protein
MDGGKAAEVLPSPGQGLSFEPMAWTSDSQRLLGLVSRSAQDPKPQGMAYMLPSKSYEKLAIESGTRRLAPLRDGKRAATSTNARHGIDLVDTRSGESRVLLPLLQVRYIQTWAISPDEKYLFVNRATEQADIWLATLE